MPTSELCSSCFLDRLKMMQASPYSVYRQVGFYRDALQAAVKRCALSNQPTATKDSPFPTPTPEEIMCLSEIEHTTQSGDTCDSLAVKYNVSSAAIFSGNPDILDCYNMVKGVKLCMPLPCTVYKLQKEDTCPDVRYHTGISTRVIRWLNPWIKRDCSNIQSATETLGRVLCVSPPGGHYDFNSTVEDADPAYPEYAPKVVEPPKGSVLAANTTTRCGSWHTVEKGNTECGNILSRYHISLHLFTGANPSVSSKDCTGSLVPGLTYCVGPTEDFLDPPLTIPDYYRYGCYAHDTTVANRSALQHLEVMHVQNMTVLSCMVYCLSESNSVFGLENGDSCLCDNSLRIGSVRLDSDKCNKKCNGNSSDACGGDEAVEVYSLQTTLPVEAESLGCFASTESKPILPKGESVEEEDGMFIQKCGSLCAVSNHTMFALSEGSVCTCGDEMAGSAKAVNATNCEVDCSNGRGYYCGGTGFAEVYTTKPGKK